LRSDRVTDLSAGVHRAAIEERHRPDKLARGAELRRKLENVPLGVELWRAQPPIEGIPEAVRLQGLHIEVSHDVRISVELEERCRVFLTEPSEREPCGFDG
jgi:hypothetical protein